MNSILFMASDFIDRMSNPSYGIHINEEYSLRYAKLLSDESFDYRLAVELEQLDDIESLTGHGWLWILGIARSKEITVNENLLLSLIQRWNDVFIQATIIDVATRQSASKTDGYKISEDSWLTKLILLCTTLPEIDQREKYESNDIDTSLAEHVLIALLQVGRQSSIQAASRLMNIQWQGQSKLREFFRVRLTLFDEETASLWRENLDFPYSE